MSSSSTRVSYDHNDDDKMGWTSCVGGCKYGMAMNFAFTGVEAGNEAFRFLDK